MSARAGAGRLRYVLSIALTALLGGCAAPELVVLLPSETGKTGEVAVLDERGAETVVLSGPLAAAEIDAQGSAKPVSLSTKTLRERFGALPSAMPDPPASYLLYFEFGLTRLTPASLETLQSVLADVRQRGGAEIEVIGHTDTVGEPEDNDRLATQRATTVAGILRANAIDGSIIIVSARGERELLVPTPDNVREERNRRVQVIVR